MQVGYSRLWTRASAFSKQLLVAGGLVVLPVTMAVEKRNAAHHPVPAKAPNPIPMAKPDPRAVRLSKFLSRLQCPITNLADDFVHEADNNHLDWRLLPSISLIESSGGKAYRNNNIFGWDNGDVIFPSIRAGLGVVAYKLGRSPLYRNRDSVGKLRLYNPDETYVGRVVEVMNRISPFPKLTYATD